MASVLQERTREINRLHKSLQDAGLKLASVATGILGASGRARLAALVRGAADPAALADLARGRLRAKRPALQEALAGRFRPHYAFLVTQLRAHLDYLGGHCHRERPDRDGARPLPGRAGSPRHHRRGGSPDSRDGHRRDRGGHDRHSPRSTPRASWAGLCPGHTESAGTHRSGRTRQGNRSLRAALVETALAASRKKGRALTARYRRLVRHRGHKKAIVAVAHAILRAAYQVLAHRAPYRELGADYFDRRHRERVTRRAVLALERQGYRVTLQPGSCAMLTRPRLKMGLRGLLEHRSARPGVCSQPYPQVRVGSHAQSALQHRGEFPGLRGKTS